MDAQNIGCAPLHPGSQHLSPFGSGARTHSWPALWACWSPAEGSEAQSALPRQGGHQPGRPTAGGPGSGRSEAAPSPGTCPQVHGLMERRSHQHTTVVRASVCPGTGERLPRDGRACQPPVSKKLQVLGAMGICSPRCLRNVRLKRIPRDHTFG